VQEFEFSQQWGHHANGTASMGPDPKNNVVGSDFHVWGPNGQPIENLWAASASTTPAAVNPGPFIQLYIAGAVGEAASDAIGSTRAFYPPPGRTTRGRALRARGR